MDATEAAAVLARARQGDSDAFRVLVERHSQSVFRLAFRMTGNEQDAEDVVQESFLRAYRQIGRFEARANFEAPDLAVGDRKSTRLNSSHTVISYAVFCLKKKKQTNHRSRRRK